MSITTFCTECSARSQDGILKHEKTCSAAKPTVTTLESKMPAIGITFDSPKEQAEWLRKMKGGSGERLASRKLAPVTPNGDLDALIDEHIHMLGCQAMTEARNLGYAQAKRTKVKPRFREKELLDMIERHEKALTEVVARESLRARKDENSYWIGVAGNDVSAVTLEDFQNRLKELENLKGGSTNGQK